MRDALSQLLSEHRDVLQDIREDALSRPDALGPSRRVGLSEMEIPQVNFIDPDRRMVLEPFFRSRARWERVKPSLMAAASSLGLSVVGDECVDILKKFNFRCMEGVQPSESGSSPVSRARAVNRPDFHGLPENSNGEELNWSPWLHSTEGAGPVQVTSGRYRSESRWPGLRSDSASVPGHLRSTTDQVECSDSPKSKRLRRSRMSDSESSPLSAQDLIAEASNILDEDWDATKPGDDPMPGADRFSHLSGKMPKPLHPAGTKVLYANRVHTYEGPKHGAAGHHSLRYQGYKVDAHEDDFKPYTEE